MEGFLYLNISRIVFFFTRYRKNDDLELKNKNLLGTLSLKEEKIKALKEERAWI